MGSLPPDRLGAWHRPLALARALAGLLVAASGGYLVLLKAGKVTPRPEALAVLAAAAGLALLPAVLAAGAAVVRGPRRISSAAEAIAAAGLLLVLGGGLANWLFSVQGFIAVAEREPVRLDRAADVEALEIGPLASRRELRVTIALARLQLAGAGADRFKAVSHLRLIEDGGDEIGLSIERGKMARYKTLLFHQGAFGFAPRVVILKGKETLLDTFVPFRTIREGPEGIAFVGKFEVAREQLLVRGAVTLDDLDDDMKGHPKLEVSVVRAGAAIGAGTLAPGEVAPLADGYAVGFAGLRRWAEIDFSRRTYTVPMLVGLALFVAGAALWPLAAWRRW